MLAFASSSLDDQKLSEWIAFVSGCMGTTSMVMLLFSNYSARASRSRTRELNEILEAARITPMPQIAYESSGDGDGAPVDSDDVRLSMHDMRQIDENVKNAVEKALQKQTMPSPSP